MKKLALSAILGASLMVTSSAFALTSMSDSNMKAATGQSGVSITLDNIVIEQYVGATTYTDVGGTGTMLNGSDNLDGAITITEKHVIKEYLGITSGTEFDSEFLAATGKATQHDWIKAAALTIDVGNCSILADGLNNNATAVTAAINTVTTNVTTNAAVTGYLYNAYVAALPVGSTPDSLAVWAALPASVTAIAATEASAGAANITFAARAAALVTAGAADDQTEAGKYLKSAAAGFKSKVAGVVIGLPTIMINTTSDEYSVGVKMADAINDGKNFIKINKGASSMMILSGTVEIAAH